MARTLVSKTDSNCIIMLRDYVKVPEGKFSFHTKLNGFPTMTLLSKSGNCPCIKFLLNEMLPLSQRYIQNDF